MTDLPMGIILAGGLGTRLRPMTLVTNKHLLPVYDRPMIYYPLEMLISNGVEDIVMVTGPEAAGDFVQLLGSGSRFSCRLTYRVQEKPAGIADALSLVSDLIVDRPAIVALGDNIFLPPPRIVVGSSRIYLARVDNPTAYGVPLFDGEGRLTGVVEKPSIAPTGYAVTGLYVYIPGALALLPQLKPSARGELEISDLNNALTKNRRLSYDIYEGFWGDAGTPEGIAQIVDHIRGRETGDGG